MGDVIQAEFGTEREWSETREKLVNGLVSIGALFGDDETLMRAKAECVYKVLREIVEGLPPVRVASKLPEDLSGPHLEAVTVALQLAVSKGIEIGMTHSVRMMMDSIYDMCTSKLKGQMS